MASVFSALHPLHPPVVAVNGLADTLELSYRGAANLLGRLAADGVLEEVEGLLPGVRFRWFGSFGPPQERGGGQGALQSRMSSCSLSGSAVTVGRSSEASNCSASKGANGFENK